MITINNVLHSDERRKTVEIPYSQTTVIDGTDLVLLPTLIDPHVHFRVPGLEAKEDFIYAGRAAFKGGVLEVFDMPNVVPPTVTEERLLAKCQRIEEQIKQAGVPIKYQLFFGADKNNFAEIAKIKNHPNIVGVKVFMGASTGELLMDDISSLHAIYALCKAHHLIIALHAEDECTIQANTKKYQNDDRYEVHSMIRNVDAARKAVAQVIELAKMYHVPSYILHTSSKAELALVQAAKADNIPVYAETCPHYLFMDISHYATLGGKAKMNPALRDQSECDYLWQAIKEGIVDTIGTDHAPHEEEHKCAVVHRCPSGVPGVETSLNLLLTAYKEGKISLSDIVRLTSTNPRKIFNRPADDSFLLADITHYKTIRKEDLFTKCRWSPYEGLSVTGYVQYIYTNNRLYAIDELENPHRANENA